MKKRMLVSLLLATAAAATLSACGSGSKPAETQATTNQGGGDITSAAEEETEAEAEEEASAGSDRYLVWRLNKEPKLWDPTNNSESISDAIVKQLFEGLTVSTSDGFKPGIAESWDVSEDGKTYTFHLKDAKWSNGDAVTAADFVFGWQRAVDPANASEYSYMLSDIGQVVNAAEIIAGEKPVTDLGVTAVDDKTLEVQLNVPVSYFLSLMYFPTFYPVNEAFFNTCKDTFGTSPDTVLSNGAFIMTDYQPAATAFELTKNPDYYDAANIALDGLAYQVIKDSQQALMSYQNGDLDITLLNGEQVEQVKDDPEFTSVPVQKGDMILLCTDGLTNVLPKEKIEEIFTKGGFYDIPDRLVDAANAGGGPDNITALLLGVEPLEVKHG